MATGNFRTAGGWVLELDLPLAKLMREQADRGELVRVQEDGDGGWTQYEEPAEDEGQDDGSQGSQEPQEPTPAAVDDPASPEAQVASQAAPAPSLPMPNKAGSNSSRQEWEIYAKSVDPTLTKEELDGMNRADLIARYGS